MFLIDDRVIAEQDSRSGLQVLAQRHEVMWRDGTSVTLHPVQARGVPMVLLRAVALLDDTLMLVDLERMQPRLGLDLRQALERDQPGVVFYGLRQAYKSALLFLAASARHSTGSWHPTSSGPVWRAAPRAIDAEVLVTADLVTLSRTPAATWCPQ